MKINPTIGLAAALGLTAFTFSVSTASAAIVCNDDGDCWHVKNKYTYPPSVQLHVYGDDWKWGADQHYRWHEHGGRGYWKGGVWIGF
jgi:hypothetical protein